jgi:ankyrin repeat protein
LPFALLEQPGEFHLNQLDLDYGSSPCTSNSPDYVWLFLQLLRAYQEGHIDAIKAVGIDAIITTSNLMIEYLVIAAAASGKYQVVQYLWGKGNSALKELFVVSDLTRYNALGPIEHAAISGHSHIVRYLAASGARPHHTFTSSLIFKELFDEAVKKPNIHTVESFFMLRNLSDNHTFITGDYLSEKLVSAVTDGYTAVVRIFLENGVNPSKPNQAGSTTLVRLDPTPLYIACYHGHLNVVELLISHGAEVNFPSPAAVIYIQQRKASSAIISYSLDQRLDNLNAILSGTVSKEGTTSGNMSWQLPINAAMAGGHADIVNALISSGALWPEEFDSLYGSYLGPLDFELEDFAIRVFYSLIKSGSLPQNREGVDSYMAERTGSIRTWMIEMGMPTVTASRIHSVAELEVFTAVLIASQQNILTVLKKEILGPRMLGVNDDRLNSPRDRGNSLQATLIRLIRHDGCSDILVQALLGAGASLTSFDVDGVSVPNIELVEAAICGNSILRQALLDVGVAAAFSSFGPTGMPIHRANLARMVKEMIAPRNESRLQISRAYDICDILEAAVHSNDMEFIIGCMRSWCFPSRPTILTIPGLPYSLLSIMGRKKW